ncbi:putative late blight resistance protein homolog R1A-10 [Salvia miltiorrhiza]|uniref:putative late blight resistance protein homolog R1A-10 n=1 Tax=Salvia miltiorrhiza TaxID=226208 RepID=UPI0025ABC97F|nr:putative late blight resistance protein homolog R1A-10 [Salvia miltiorrhiza]
MAAYAALVSLTHTLHQILHPHPLTQIIIPREQIESLHHKVCFLLDFLETHSSLQREEMDDLEKKIAEAAYAAEDTIESHVVSQIQDKYPIHVAESSALSHQSFRLNGVRGLGAMVKKLGKIKYKNGIPRVIKKFQSVEKEVAMIRNKKGIEDLHSTIATSSPRPPLSREDTMVGFNEQLLQVMSALATNELNRLIIPIVGMGGIGKTTLATNVFNNPTIREYFPVRAWITVSQVYTAREILRGLLHHISSNIYADEQKSDEQLGELLYKELFGRKHLIVMDDVWDIEAWDSVRRFLPPSNDGSRVLITTRLSNLALDLGSCSSPYAMKFLDDAQSWDLLCEKVFGKYGCPVEMEEVGKSIAKKCGGLPLAIVVIGGLLASSKMTREYWESVDANVTSAINYGNDDKCMKILSLSYSHLPIHIKPCFLYLSVFPADFTVRVSKLVKLWVAEGFIKAVSNKTLEETAEEYLEELIHRNLVLVCQQGSSGKLKSCSIHHVIWDLCRREAHRHNFLHIEKFENPKISPRVERERRISIQPCRRKEKLSNPLLLARRNRTLLSSLYWDSRSITRKFSLLRILDVVDFYTVEELLHLINTRYVACAMDLSLRNSSLWKSISRLWNLETLVLDREVSLPPQIWQMPQLRHLKMERIILQDPPNAQNLVVLENLQTLSTILNFRCTDQIIQRIPNLKKLRITYGYSVNGFGKNYLCNLVQLDKLESLGIRGDEKLYGNIEFPGSLRKLALENCFIPWEDMSMIGLLPNLEVLKLRTNAAKGREWNPVEGEFCRLQFLLIHGCELEIWEADYFHFPVLRHLHLRHLKLKEIPMGFAEILTLQIIDLKYCSSSLEKSAETISEERESLGYDDFQLRLNPSEISWNEENVVGFEDEADTLIKYLNEESDELEVISITGMPGFGKTTLAWKIYQDPRIQYNFSTLIWVNVSQELNMKKVFLTILERFTELDMSVLSEAELAQKVRFYLEKKKFLLFMDDVWTSETWKTIEDSLPKSNRMGKVVITSRDERVARQVNHLREPHRLRVQDSKESWELLQLKVFGKLDECPPELEEIGSVIAKQCEGIPLAMVVMAGILVEKHPKTSDMKTQWESISASLSMYIKYDNVVENIIALSYDQLPRGSRDCFLYLGVFPENAEIPAWKLIRLWVAEGFIQRNKEKALEEVAEDILRDLVRRNLVVVDKTTARGDARTCRVHDMIREFCRNEAAVTRHNLFQEVERSSEGVFHPSASGIRSCRRLCIHSNVVDFLRRKTKGPWIVSFLCFSKEAMDLPAEHTSSIPDSFNLLRVLDVNPIKFTKFPLKLTQLTHLRYISLSGDSLTSLPKAAFELWNLQTIRVDTASRTFEIEADIWNMMQLRHLKTKAAIVINKEVRGEAGKNLQTLSLLSAHCCSEDVFNRALNLRDLGIRGQLSIVLDTNLRQLVCLQKLRLVHDVHPETSCSRKPLPRLPRADRFPPNLRVLKLSSTFLDWKHMSTLGMLRNLEVLKLKEDAFSGETWNAVGGGFPCLEFLLIQGADLRYWTASGDPLPKLKRLVLRRCRELEEFPFVLGKSLKLLEIDRVSESVVAIARKMEVEKQQRAKRDRFKLVITAGEE